jgi:predicted membrane protein
MKLIDVLIISLAVVFIIIGIYEMIQFGIGSGYWSVMLAVILFFVYNYRKQSKK